MASTEEAERIVRNLTKKYGLLDAKMMDDIGRFNSDYRRNIDENWLAMENAVSHSIKVLAKQIYGSGARFVFELLQNAEDNRYEAAKKAKASPFISFKIHPDRIIVECNEDGFTEQDLHAICAVGESTKSASHGYIGAKGIGFKSVFIAAWKVRIQSGNFSFEFQHRKTDPGIGMVRPIWVAAVEDIPGPLTRMTLFLHDQGDEEEIKYLKDMINKQFEELKETCLLFLSKLQQVTLEFYDSNGRLERSKQFRKHKLDDHRVSLENETDDRETKATEAQSYHITKKTATGLPLSDNRDAPKTEEGRKAASTAEVVLAFPITSTSRPDIPRFGCEIFAFLPLGKSNYKFLINSDFDTNASRQGIVTTSRRNLALRAWIAEAFLQAVLQFCEHPVLRYEWPLFLSDPQSAVDQFWVSLDNSITELVKENRLIRSRHRTDLRLLAEVYIPTLDLMDTDGQPVLDGPNSDVFLSRNYSKPAIQILRQYGLCYVTANIAIDLLEYDLRIPNGKMHGVQTSEEWHSVVALLLASFFDRGYTNTTARLASLALLPLNNGGWTSSQQSPVYLPTTGDIPIPKSLDIKVISPDACINKDRMALFQHLGALEASVHQVRTSVLNSFQSRSSDLFRSYLHYLYLTHDRETNTRESYNRVYLLSNGQRYLRPGTDDMYFHGTDDVYSAESLLAAEGSAPGLHVEFLHPFYMEEIPVPPSSTHPTWKDWLRDSIGIRDRLRLLASDGQALSKEFLYVFRHRPIRFLDLFERLWLRERSSLLKKPLILSRIKNLPAGALCDVTFSVSLKETWFPSTHLQELAKRYMGDDIGQFPFLKLAQSSAIDVAESKWKFLNTHFGVGMEDNVDFLLHVLERMEGVVGSSSWRPKCQWIFDLYIAIYAKLSVAGNTEEVKGKIRCYFSNSGILKLKGPNDDQVPKFTASECCLWDAPEDFVSLASLKRVYSKWLEDEQLQIVENLFHRTLHIQNATLSDIEVELHELRDEEYEDRHRVGDLYEYLEKGSDSLSDLRTVFEASSLIYSVSRVGRSGWYKLSDCVWSSDIDIRGKAILDECWKDHEHFFVEKLGVKQLTIQMVYDVLIQSPEGSIDAKKETMLSFNSFLRTEGTRLDPEPIRRAKIFPVKYPNGTVQVSSLAVEFAIGDRDTLRTKFEDKISLLDFDLEDVRRLKPFLSRLGLESRYLTNSVREQTTVSGEPGRPISSRNRDLKQKAYYIARVAATFRSPRFEQFQGAFYEQLRTMKVMEIEKISSVLDLTQNEQPHRVEVATANEHIRETPDGLIIYVPKQRLAQELCFSSVLPKKLADWLMQHPTTDVRQPVEADAVRALTSIFACDRSVLEDVLDDQGIIRVPFDNEDEFDRDSVEEYGDSVEQDTDDEGMRNSHSANNLAWSDNSSHERYITPTHTSFSNTSSSRIDSPSPGVDTAARETIVETVSQQSSMRHDAHGGANAVSVSRPRRTYLEPSSEPTASPSEVSHYRDILNRVIEKARGATVPSQGAFDMSEMRNALSQQAAIPDVHEHFDGLDVTRTFRSTSQLERDKKIGAAGELYVFELLSQLGLPGWNRNNWKSLIRSYVAIHPDYADLGRWVGRETADMVFTDSSSQLTDTLIGCGYLDRNTWEGRRMTYYIEVKTTTGPCETPFYMSGNQYQLMKRLHHDDHTPPQMYIIFRVFWVNSDRIGLRIYTDPENLRQEGQLVFTGQSWSVTPGVGNDEEGGSIED